MEPFGIAGYSNVVSLKLNVKFLSKYSDTLAEEYDELDIFPIGRGLTRIMGDITKHRYRSFTHKYTTFLKESREYYKSVKKIEKANEKESKAFNKKLSNATSVQDIISLLPI